MVVIEVKQVMLSGKAVFATTRETAAQTFAAGEVLRYRIGEAVASLRSQLLFFIILVVTIRCIQSFFKREDAFVERLADDYAVNAGVFQLS